MRSTPVLLGLLATVVAYSVNVTHTVVPNAYIVQLKNDSSTTSLSGRSLDDHAMFHKRAEDINYDVRTEFKSPDLFYGLSITVKEDLTPEEVKAKVLEIPDVEAIWPVYIITAPEPYGVKVNASAKTAKTSRASAESPGDASSLLHITGNLNVQSTHEMTEVDRVHALGIKGKGVQIAILDTGVDYRHPSLGAGFGPGFKIAGGYSFLQDDWAGQDPIESPDPIATCLSGGHGTHVTGVFAQGPEIRPR
jgi:subtilisin family serine protease